MDFKYFDAYQRLASMTEGDVICEICGKETRCFDPVFKGREEMEHICPTCLHERKLYGRSLYTNEGNYDLLLAQIKEVYINLADKQQADLATERTNEIEQATPHLLTWQDMRWPCLDGDYTKFIGYGSKPFFNSLSADGNGKELYKRSLHQDLLEYYTDEQWAEMLPDEFINSIDDTNFSMLFYVFKSLASDKLIVWWDSD